MKNNPLVSVITPSFNQAAFLEQTIQSVLSQTYTNIEYIIIDGGSADSSVDTIKKYENKLAYWVSEKDNGQSDAINKGLAKAKGQIVAYLNSDDLLEPNAVELAVEYFLKHPQTSVVYGQCIHIDENGKEISKPLGAQTSYIRLLTIGMLPHVHQPACFFNLNVIKRRPLFDAALHYVMDYELILHCIKREGTVKFIPHTLARFRYHQTSKTVAQERKMYQEKMQAQQQKAPHLFLLWWWRRIRGWKLEIGS